MGSLLQKVETAFTENNQLLAELVAKQEKFFTEQNRLLTDHGAKQEKFFAEILTEIRNHAAPNESISSLSSSSDKGEKRFKHKEEKDTTLPPVTRKSSDSDEGIQGGIEVEL